MTPYPLRGFYTVGSEAGDLAGWTPELLAEALRGPLEEVGIEVTCAPRVSGVGTGLHLLVDDRSGEAEHLIRQIMELVIQGGP